MSNQSRSLLIVLSLVVVLLLGTLFIVFRSIGSDDEPGTISGYVVDGTDSSRLKGVTVTAVDQDGVRKTKNKETDTTGDDGYFSLEIPSGTYTLTFEADGYKTFESSASYEVVKGKNLEISEVFRMAASGAAASEPATIPATQTPASQTTTVSQPVPAAASAPAMTEYTILCMDMNGNVLRNTPNQGKVGSSVTVSAPQISGYRTDMVQSTITLSSDSSANKIVFNYEPVPQNKPASIPQTTVIEKPTETTSAIVTSTEKKPVKEKPSVEITEFSMPEDAIIWNDENFGSAVCEYLGADGYLTPEDAEAVDELELKSADISDLSDLEYFPNLEKLYLNWNNISDLSPIEQLYDLQVLNVEGNLVTDLSPLSNMYCLEKLDLCDNSIEDISPLEDLTDLKMLDIRQNNVSDISVLSEMTDMEELYISDNRIEDITPIAGMTKLTYLSASNNCIDDISSLEDMKDLAVLTLTDNFITDISVLRDLKKIYHLKIRGNPIEDYSPLDDYPKKNFLEK